MSKTQLKKELALMDREQLVELLTEAYSARKEIKEYLDFFLNPDVEKLRAKYEISISKELDRVRRDRYCKARISFIKSKIKEFASFQPGFQAEMDLIFHTVSYAIAVESMLHFPETLVRGIASLISRLVDLAVENYVLEETLANLKGLLSDTRAGSRYFRRYLKDQLEAYLSAVNPLAPMRK